MWYQLKFYHFSNADMNIFHGLRRLNWSNSSLPDIQHVFLPPPQKYLSFSGNLDTDPYAIAAGPRSWCLIVQSLRFELPTWDWEGPKIRRMVGFLKMEVSQYAWLISWKTQLTWMIWGYLYCRKPPIRTSPFFSVRPHQNLSGWNMLRDDGIPKLFFDMFSRMWGSDDQPPRRLKGFTLILELLSQSALHGGRVVQKMPMSREDRHFPRATKHFDWWEVNL